MKRLITLLAATLSIAVSAQNIHLITTTDSTHATTTMHENAPQLANVPDVPRFALMGKDHAFYLGLGANIKAVALADVGHAVDNADYFKPSAIPMHPAPGNGARYAFSAQQSNIYLNIVAMPDSKDKVGVYISIMFNGNNYAPTVDHAYIRWRGLTAGYTVSLFTDLAACPPTIDHQGPNAFTFDPRGTVMYEQPFGKDGMWKAGVGIDMSKYSFTNATHTATVSQRIPDIPVYLQRSWAGGDGHMRLSAVLRNLYYRDTAIGSNHNHVGWGVKLSGVTPISGGLSAFFQAIYGKGIESYIQDLGGLGLDLTPDPDNPARLQAPAAWGAYGGLKCQFSPKVFATATYSQVRTYASRYSDSPTPWGDGYRYGQYIVGNVFWNVNSIIQLGAEYIYGRRVDYNGTAAHDSRIEAMLQVSF